jgi:hypothetical protein
LLIYGNIVKIYGKLIKVFNGMSFCPCWVIILKTCHLTLSVLGHMAAIVRRPFQEISQV